MKSEFFLYNNASFRMSEIIAVAEVYQDYTFYVGFYMKGREKPICFFPQNGTRLGVKQELMKINSMLNGTWVEDDAVGNDFLEVPDEGSGH